MASRDSAPPIHSLKSASTRATANFIQSSHVLQVNIDPNNNLIQPATMNNNKTTIMTPTPSPTDIASTKEKETEYLTTSLSTLNLLPTPTPSPTPAHATALFSRKLGLDPTAAAYEPRAFTELLHASSFQPQPPTTTTTTTNHTVLAEPQNLPLFEPPCPSTLPKRSALKHVRPASESSLANSSSLNSREASQTLLEEEMDETHMTVSWILNEMDTDVEPPPPSSSSSSSTSVSVKVKPPKETWGSLDTLPKLHKPATKRSKTTQLSPLLIHPTPPNPKTPTLFHPGQTLPKPTPRGVRFQKQVQVGECWSPEEY
ncbi:hypothetical protein HDV05_002147, partial [Chytridiales sp. JEL 0842]